MKSRARIVLALMMSGPFLAQSAWASQTDLLAYTRQHISSGPTAPSVPKYNRLKQFGTWVHQDPNKGCFDTRESVLARSEDPSVPLRFGSSGCTISGGQWHDPYTGNTFTDAADIQIDHVVPLKAAYYAGAYAWTPSERCNYANFMANNIHLMAVSGHENMSKGDKGPDGYLPPDQRDHCAYVSSWMKIKTIWKLTSTPAEVTAIEQVLQRQNCTDQFRFIEDKELSTQRSVAAQPIRACANFTGLTNE